MIKASNFLQKEFLQIIDLPQWVSCQSEQVHLFLLQFQDADAP